MKKLPIFSVVVLIISQSAKAQTTPLTRRVLDENTVVKDSSGKRCPYAVWTKLLTSGEYRLVNFNPNSDSSSYFLKKYKPGQRARELKKVFATNDTSSHLSANPMPQQKESLTEAIPRPPESNFFTEGQTIESFSAHDINGNKIKLKDLTGKVVVLNFWFIGCPPCRMEIPELNKLATKYANDSNVVFVAIALDYKSDIKNFLKDNPFAYQIIDNGRMFANIYRINLYPTNVVLDKEGKVRFHASGYPSSTPYWIEKTIKQALEH